jgi:4-hydroxysphinganine ceramide fatty acyl 2-hydroxylase
LKKIARFFDNPLLELLSRTPWYVVPLIWLPVSAAMFSEAVKTQSIDVSLALFVSGLAFWSFLEYVLHRFVFHLDEYLPDNKIAIMIHFTMHGVHHFLPMDR